VARTGAAGSGTGGGRRGAAPAQQSLFDE